MKARLVKGALISAGFVLLCGWIGARAIAEPGTAKVRAVDVNGQKIEYQAIVERFSVSAPGKQNAADVTTVSYMRAPHASNRPVIFAFNGGPGASSIYLNLGLLGPLRVDLPANPATPIPQRAALVANADTVLDVADIVLIDPVGTGFSRLRNPSTSGYFYSVKGDAQSIADAIAAWTRGHDRQASRKFILGESYGAVRSVFVASDMLACSETNNVNGVVMLSQSLQIVDTVQRRSNIVGQVAGMPTLAATAWYHKLAGRDVALEDFVRDAENFARTAWLPALMAGTTISVEVRRRVAGGLSRFTGLPTEYFLDHDLYLSKEEYRHSALAKRGLLLGLYDTRYVGPLNSGRDPDDALSRAIEASADAMWQTEFSIEPPSHTAASGAAADRIGDVWAYVTQPFAPTDGGNYRQIDYVADLIELMRKQPSLRLLVAGGWYDTAASAGADNFLLSRPGLDQSRISSARFPAGHMFYTDPQSRMAFASRLRTFVSLAK